MTYAELVEQIQDMLEYEELDFIAAIPDFVKRAEDDIYHSVRLLIARKNLTATIGPGLFSITLPTDFLAPIRMLLDHVAPPDFNDPSINRILTNVDFEFLREVYPHSNLTGIPRYYALSDSEHIVIAPSADTTYRYGLFYFYKPESIVTASTTWLGDNAPNALFYGTVLQAYRFMKGDADTMAEYQKAYDKAISNLRILAEGYMRKDTYRTPNARVET